MVRKHRKWTGALMVGVIVLSGCGDDGGSAGGSTSTGGPAAKPDRTASTPTSAPKPSGQSAAVDLRSPDELAKAGRSVYTANCIACHNMNPAEDGALGPAVAGASLALLEARVLRGEYPEGHTPSRPSKIMVPLPHLEPKLPELAAYLASAK